MSYRKKNQYLLIGAILFLFIAWFVAGNKTYSLYSQNKTLSFNIQKGEDAPKTIGQLERKLNFFNSRLATFLSDSSKDENYMLEVVGNFCKKNRIVLKEFPPVSSQDEGDFIILTNKIIAEGNYKDLLRLVYELEQKSQVGRVTSVDFSSCMDNKRKKTVLAVSIYLQNIKLKK